MASQTDLTLHHKYNIVFTQININKVIPRHQPPSWPRAHGTSTAGQSRVGHQDSHLVAQGPPPSPSSFAFAVARHLPFPRPFSQAPPFAARPRHLPYPIAPADARHQVQHQHDVLSDASEEHHLPPPAVGDALSYRKHALPPLRAEY